MPVIYKPFNGILFSAQLQINLNDQDTEQPRILSPEAPQAAAEVRAASCVLARTHMTTTQRLITLSKNGQELWGFVLCTPTKTSSLLSF